MLLGANCPQTYYGPGLGSWSLPCSLDVPKPTTIRGVGPPVRRGEDVYRAPPGPRPRRGPRQGRKGVGLLRAVADGGRRRPRGPPDPRRLRRAPRVLPRFCPRPSSASSRCDITRGRTGLGKSLLDAIQRVGDLFIPSLEVCLKLGEILCKATTAVRSSVKFTLVSALNSANSALVSALNSAKSACHADDRAFNPAEIRLQGNDRVFDFGSTVADVEHQSQHPQCPNCRAQPIFLRRPGDRH